MTNAEHRYRMRSRALLAPIGALLLCACSPLRLQTFTVREHLGRRAVDELVHFDFDVAAGSSELSLTDAAGAPLSAQVTGVTRERGRVRGAVWTLLSLEPHGEATVVLQTGPSTALPGVAVERGKDRIVLANDRFAITLPAWPGRLPRAASLTSLPAPIGPVRAHGTAWLSDTRWANDGPALRVTEATTTVLEQGPVRATVEQRLTFDDGRTYRALITLAARQDAATITEDSDVVAPKAGLRLSMQPGLGADRVLWHSQYQTVEGHPPWALIDLRPSPDREAVVCRLRPWSFWWLPQVAGWAGFYREGGESRIGVLPLRPSRWTPDDWDGFDRTEIPVTTRPSGGLDLTFSFAAEEPQSARKHAHGLHREWALTAWTARDHRALGSATAKLRADLVRRSEFPLDEVKDYGFDFTPAPPTREHPYLVISRADVERLRRQATSVPAVAARVRAAVKFLDGCGGLDATLEKEGPDAFYRRYLGHYMIEQLPEAYLGTGDPRYGRMLAAAVKGMAKGLVETFVTAPLRPAIGAFGPWYSEEAVRLALNHDLIADAGFLTAEEERSVRDALVLGAHVLAHPDYWNTPHGLSASNQNMTSSILLPRGLLGLALRGHPEADRWLAEGESELGHEIAEWISPGGAWIENPYYQVASLDGLMLFAQALRNVTGRDAFASPRLKETLDYYGFLLTPPDPRFPPRRAEGTPAPMVLPSIGNAYAGFVTAFNGWAALATAKTDPAFSARQQFYWQGQRFAYGSAGRAKGLVPAVTDPALPAAPPTELARAFPGFGSVMRTSWTDPRASYVAHRTGPISGHYENDQGSFVYVAKGAPLCPDWGNDYSPLSRNELWFHDAVSFDKGDSPKHFSSHGALVEVRSLPSHVDYSYGVADGHGGQRDDRHLLLVKSADPLGANYLVARDVTSGTRDQMFYWNLFCLAREAEVAGDVIHFPGQLGVDLDLHVLSPAAPAVEKDRWAWKQPIPNWGEFEEEQHGVRLAKTGPRDDFLVVLYPRARGQAAARTIALGGGAGMRVEHMEGVDHLLVSPAKPTSFTDGDVRLEGEIAFARRYRGGTLRLSVVKGRGAAASAGVWRLASSGPTALEIVGKAITGECDGEARAAALTLPDDYGPAVTRLDGAPIEAKRDGRTLTIDLPAGVHRFRIEPR